MTTPLRLAPRVLRLAPTVLLGLAAIAAEAGTLTDGRPEGLVPDGTIARWLSFAGEVTDGADRVSYRLIVDPANETYYRVTQYRRTPLQGEAATTEKLLWNAHPGVREPLSLFERVDGAWRPIPTEDERYRPEMFRAIRVYMLYRQSLADGSR